MSAVLDEMRSLSRTTGHGAIFGVAGFSGSGKTTLAEKLIRCFCERNIEIAVVNTPINILRRIMRVRIAIAFARQALVR